MKDSVDVTEEIAKGDVSLILAILHRHYQCGYDRLYWDGYDSSIVLYKNNKIDE